MDETLHTSIGNASCDFKVSAFNAAYSQFIICTFRRIGCNKYSMLTRKNYYLLKYNLKGVNNVTKLYLPI